jgi:hypothetical protein
MILRIGVSDMSGNNITDVHDASQKIMVSCLPLLRSEAVI